MLAVSVGLALTLGGCASQSATEQAGSPAAPSDQGVPPPLQFQGTSLDGSTLNGADFAGKATALWFWAPW